MAKLLLMAGSNVNDQSGEHCCGVTPLHDAAENGHVNVVKLLLSHGASINLKDHKVSLEKCAESLYIISRVVYMVRMLWRFFTK